MDPIRILPGHIPLEAFWARPTEAWDQDSMEGLCILSVLGTPWGPLGQAVKWSWGEGCLCFSPVPVTSVTQLWESVKRWRWTCLCHITGVNWLFILCCWLVLSVKLLVLSCLLMPPFWIIFCSLYRQPVRPVDLLSYKPFCYSFASLSCTCVQSCIRYHPICQSARLLSCKIVHSFLPLFYLPV